MNQHLKKLTIAALLVTSIAKGDDSSRGKSIYQKQCARCHGAAGEGVAKHYDKPLTGDATVGELTTLISETMPEDDPDACVGKDAAAVAVYIHSEFYSKQPELPRIRLARLTGSQLRRSLADLYGHFGGVARIADQHGLRGEYYQGSRRKTRKIERVDDVIDFDFGDKGPGKGIDPKDFAITWTGAVKADVTGRYEIVIRSTCAFVSHFGSNDRELINNHVQSGDKTEFRRSLVLTAGRVYPLRIQFYQRKRKTKQPPAKISLSWTSPHGVEQIIPARNLLPSNVPSAFALQTKLPPDDRSYGYERGIAVDRQWDDSTTTAAIEFAQIAADELWPRYKRRYRGKPNENRQLLRGFLREVIETAFRGPLQDDRLKKLYIDAPVDASEDDAEAIKRSLLVTLKSPRFLYPLLDYDRSPSQQAANRLALTLFDSLPSDSSLVQQAQKNVLQNENQIRAAARRMTSDYRTRGKTREFLYAWLNLDHVGEINKDAKKFPGFDDALTSALRASLDAFLDDVVWSEASDYRQFFQADWTYTNATLIEFYGDTWKTSDEETTSNVGLTKSIAAPEKRLGLLTHPYLMSGLAYPDSTSPIHRGVFLIRYMLGRTLRPPNEAFTPLSPDLHPDLTTRERIALQTSPKNCQVCHAKINALGFTLENFDAVGRYRTKEKGREIDAKGGYTTRVGKHTKLDGPRALAAFLANSDDAQRAFVDRAFEYFVKQPAAAYGADTLDKLVESFRKNEFNIQKLLIEIAVVSALPKSK